MIRLLFILIIAALITPVAYAQTAANAVMNISVKVVKTSGLTLDAEEKVNLSNRNGNSSNTSIGRVTLSNLDQNNLFIGESSHILLKRNDGKQFKLPVVIDKQQNGNRVSYQLMSGNDDIIPKGTYNGTYTARIEYL